MSGPRQIQPLVFLQETRTAPSSEHPANSQPGAPSFADYVAAREPKAQPELTEEQTIFRRMRAGESATESVEDDYPQDDVPDV